MDTSEQSVAERALKIIVMITNTEEVKGDLDLKLFEVGLLDSLGAVQLMVAISEEFGIEISPSEIERDDLSTPRKIIEFVNKRTAK